VAPTAQKIDTAALSLRQNLQHQIAQVANEEVGLPRFSGRKNGTVFGGAVIYLSALLDASGFFAEDAFA
jgi:hypothetical protein